MSAHATKDCPTVSIALPVFNGENYLGQAIELVLAQSYTDFELVICDNASTDAHASDRRGLRPAGPARPLPPQPAQSGRRPQLQPRVRALPRPLRQMAGARRPDRARLPLPDRGRARPASRPGLVQHGGGRHRRGRPGDRQLCQRARQRRSALGQRPIRALRHQAAYGRRYLRADAPHRARRLRPAPVLSWRRSGAAGAAGAAWPDAAAALAAAPDPRTCRPLHPPGELGPVPRALARRDAAADPPGADPAALRDLPGHRARCRPRPPPSVGGAT